MSYKIKSVNAFGELSTLEALSNSATAGKDDLFLNGFQVDIEIILDGMEFNISFQNEERSNGMMAYSPWGMTTSASFGNDADESGILYSHLKKSDQYEQYQEIIDECGRMAEELAKKEYQRLINN